MDTITTLTQVPAYFAVPRPRVSTWDAPIQGSGMSGSAPELGRTAGIVSAHCTTVAMVAKGANRKDATGDPAFEDPD